MPPLPSWWRDFLPSTLSWRRPRCPGRHFIFDARQDFSEGFDFGLLLRDGASERRRHDLVLFVGRGSVLLDLGDARRLELGRSVRTLVPLLL